MQIVKCYSGNQKETVFLKFFLYLSWDLPHADIKIIKVVFRFDSRPVVGYIISQFVNWILYKIKKRQH